MKKNTHALSLIELILGLTLLTMIVSTLYLVNSTFNKLITKNIHQAMLLQPTTFAMEHITKKIQTSNCLEIPSETEIILTRKNIAGEVERSKYFLGVVNNIKELRFAKDADNLNDFEVLLRNIKDTGGFKVTGVEVSGSGCYRAARVILQAVDPKNPTASGACLQSLAGCRIPLTNAPIKLVNSSGILKDYYDSLQDAIDSAADGDEILCMGEVSGVFNGKFNLTQRLLLNTNSKSIILKGSFNADFSQQSLQNTPTTIQPANGSTVNCAMVIGSSSTVSTPRNITIDRFCVANFYSSAINDVDGADDYRLDKHNISITNNKIFSNYVSGASTCGISLGIFSANSGEVRISHNEMENNGSEISVWGGFNNIEVSHNKIIMHANVKDEYGIFCGNDYKHKQIKIYNNDISLSNITPSGSFIRAVICSAMSDNVLIANNNITGFKDSAVADDAPELITVEIASPILITNNKISDNTLTGESSTLVWARGQWYGGHANDPVTIKNNYFGHNDLTLSPGTYVIEADWNTNFPSASNNLFEDNKVSFVDSGWGGGCIIEGGHNGAIFKNNTFRNNAARKLISAGWDDGVTMKFENNLVESNTLWVGPCSDSANAIFYGMYPEAKNNIYANNTFENNCGNEFYINSSAVPGSSSFENDTIVSKLTGTGKIFHNYFTLGSIKNCIIYGASPAAQLGAAGSVNVSYSDIRGATPNPSKGIINQDPLFVDAVDGDYHLQASSFCKTAGEGGIEIGAYGGTGAAAGIGVQTVVDDDSTTAEIREDIIGTYGTIGPES